MASVQTSFTPAAAAYSAGDVIEGAKEIFLVGGSSASEVLITASRLLVEHTALISGEGAYDLHLYNATPPSALADNAAWDLPAGDRASYLGKISLGTPADVGSSLFIEQTGINKQLGVPAGGSLWAYLVTVAAFTPTAAARKVVLKSLVI